ncbi:hypothetical protein GOP47_0028418 [Adiantum capillus-veneris]|nr:hypothetical protein GOP47_0028418 [Adiantum capillus-veneris]
MPSTCNRAVEACPASRTERQQPILEPAVMLGSGWRQVWEEKAGAPDVVVKWEKALKALNAFNGEIFTQGTSEALYINRVVHNLCKVLPSPLTEDLSPIKGLHRLAKEVSGQFNN